MSGKNRKRGRKHSRGHASGNWIRLSIALVLVIIAVLVLLAGRQSAEPALQVGDDGVLVYSKPHLPEYTVSLVEDNATYTLSEIRFRALDGSLRSALLRMPKKRGVLPGVVILPGATVSKEGAQYLAGHLSEMGYASLALDQRNLGVINFEQDYQLFASGRTPLEYKMVSDALLAVDILASQRRVDSKRLGIIGESNGGRIAIIAGALHPQIRLIIGISTSGYNTEAQLTPQTPELVRRFYRSIDPDTYLRMLPPKKLVMIHADHDPVIPLRLAEYTYQKAGEPKALFVVSASTHGYNEQMRPVLEKVLLG